MSVEPEPANSSAMLAVMWAAWGEGLRGGGSCGSLGERLDVCAVEEKRAVRAGKLSNRGELSGFDKTMN